MHGRIEYVFFFWLTSFAECYAHVSSSLLRIVIVHLFLLLHYIPLYTIQSPVDGHLNIWVIFSFWLLPNSGSVILVHVFG